MTAHTRTANLAPGFLPATTAHMSTRRVLLVAASVVIQAIIVLGFVASSLGVGGTTYPDRGPGPLTPPARIAPARVGEANPVPVLEPAPAPAPAPGL